MFSLIPSLVLAFSWGPAQAAWRKPKEPARAARPSYEDRVQALRQEHYVGVGQAEYGGAKERGAARKEAAADADEDLAKGIQVQVNSVTRMFLKEGIKDGRLMKKEGSVKKIVRTSVDLVLGSRESEDFNDQPGVITVVAFVRKEAADRELAESLKMKKSRVVEFLRQADRAREAKDLPAALKGFLDARQSLTELFAGAPLSATLAPGAAPVEAGAFVDIRLDELIASLALTADGERISLTPEGAPRAPAVISVSRRGPAGLEPVANLPLSGAFTKGKGRLAAAFFTTDAFGKARVPVEWVDPSRDESILEIGIDGEALPGLGGRPNLPRRAFRFSRSKILAYSIGFSDGEAPPSLKEFASAARGLIIDAGLVPKELALAKDAAPKAQTSQARAVKADYLLVVRVAASTNYDPEFKLHEATVKSSVSLLGVVDSTEALSPGPEAKAVAATAEKARASAIAKIEKGLLELIRRKIFILR